MEQIALSSLNDNGYKYGSVKVSGSSLNTPYKECIEKIADFKSSKNKMQALYKDYLQKRPKVSVSEGLSRLAKVTNIDDSIKTFVKTFIKSNGTNPPAGIYAFRTNLFSGNVGIFSAADIQDIISSFSSDIQTTAYFKQVLKEARTVQQSAVGSKFMDLNLQNTKDQAVKLSSLVGKGRYVLVDFWGSACIPCRKEFPHVKERYERYHKLGFEIIGVSVDMHKVRRPRAMSEEQQPWPQFAYLTKKDASRGQQVYNHMSIPFCVLIGPDGTIIDRNMLGVYMDKKLIELYGDQLSKN